LEVGGVRALRPCGAAFVKKKRTFLGVLYGSPDTRAQERGEDGGGGDAQRRMGRARALGSQAGGTAACAARRVRAQRGICRQGADTQRTTGRSGQRRRAGRVSRRPFDAAPPGLNRGAGLVPGTQVAGRRRRRPGGGGGGQQQQGTEVELALPTWSRVGRVWGGHMNQTAAPLFAMRKSLGFDIKSAFI